MMEENYYLILSEHLMFQWISTYQAHASIQESTPKHI